MGVIKGDRVAIYLPMIPEAAVAMLACARIGAVHSVVFGGFSAESLRDRINDAEAVALITADGGYRRGQILPLKRFADEALLGCPSIRNVIVVRRRHVTILAGFAVAKRGRDFRLPLRVSRIRSMPLPPIIFEDDSLIAFDKPSGLLVAPDRSA